MRVIEQIIYHLHSRGRLTVRDMDFLAAEGFYAVDPEAEEWVVLASERGAVHQEVQEHEDRYDPEERAAQELRARSRGSRSHSSRPTLKAAELSALIASKRPEWAEALEPLVALACRLDASANLLTAPHLLQKAPPAALLPLLAEGLRADAVWFSALWRALPFEAYREGSWGGPAGNAYRAILTGRDPHEIIKYAWILREPEISWVYALVVAQRKVTAACAQLYDAHFPLIATHLGREYRSNAFTPYVLLYSARKYAAGRLPSQLLTHEETALPMDLMPAADSPLWAQAMDMERRTALPYMLHARTILAIRNHKNAQDLTPSLVCPKPWFKPY